MPGPSLLSGLGTRGTTHPSNIAVPVLDAVRQGFGLGRARSHRGLANRTRQGCSERQVVMVNWQQERRVVLANGGALPPDRPCHSARIMGRIENLQCIATERDATNPVGLMCLWVWSRRLQRARACGIQVGRVAQENLWRAAKSR